MPKTFRAFKTVLFTVFAAFLGFFGLSNLVPNSVLNAITGNNTVVTPAKKDVINRKGGLGGSRRTSAIWKPQSLNRKKHTNLLHKKADARRKIKLKAKK